MRNAFALMGSLAFLLVAAPLAREHFPLTKEVTA